MMKFRNFMVVGLMSLVIALSGCGSNKALFDAVESGDYETIKLMMKDNVNVDVKDSNGNSPIYYAIKNDVVYEKIKMEKSVLYQKENQRIVAKINEKFSDKVAKMKELQEQSSAKIKEQRAIISQINDATSVGQINALSRKSRSLNLESRKISRELTKVTNDYVKDANEYKKQLAVEDEAYKQALEASNKAYKESKTRHSLMAAIMVRTTDKKGIRIDGKTVPEYVVGTKKVAEYISNMSAFK